MAGFASIPPARAGSYPVRDGNRVRPLVDGEPAFRRICEAVEDARHSVWVTVAFLHRDVRMPDGRGSFFAVLDAAVERDVDVRVLFWRSPELEKVLPGVHFSGTTGEREWLVDRGSRFRARWDSLPRHKCHHQKSWLIDAGRPGEVAFVGGINLVPKAVVPAGHPPREGGSNHDVYLELAGPAATDVHHNFVQRWNGASERDREDGSWPTRALADDLPFPSQVSPAAGSIPVQITRTIMAGRYSDQTATPGGVPFAVADGERSVLEQYLAAIDAARSSLYFEDQTFGSLAVLERVEKALDRGVEVVYVVPGGGHPWLSASRDAERNRAFFQRFDALRRFEGFTLAGLAANDGAGGYSEVYVHAKLLLVDDAWATIGSANVWDRSLYADTELNASFWCLEAVRSLRVELLREHLGSDTGGVDDRTALRNCAERARHNACRRASGQRLEGLIFALDPARYGIDDPALLA
jgi:phosphatidylserine/phosphatidylglycerophosphate/cardiolipin synthase-like enzyme